MRRALSIFLALMLVITVFAGCAAEKENKAAEATTETTEENDQPEAVPVKPVGYGANGEIPCLELTNQTFATSDVAKWEFTEMGEDENGKTYGYAEESVSQEDAPIVNWYVGDGTYLTKYILKPGSTAYELLIGEMKKAGYEVYTTGTLGQGDVHSTTLTHQSFVYHVTYCAGSNELFVTASAERPLSPYLMEDNTSTQSQAIDGLETTLNMLSWQENGGDNYIIQLKNGNFILFDGGDHNMLKQAVEFMKANTSAGKTPVVEAWFITHGHYDHVGWTRCYLYEASKNEYLFQDGEAAEAFRVNGIYYNMPDEYIIDNTIYGWRSDAPTTSATGMRTRNENAWPYRVAKAAEKMKTETGEQTPVYRPQTGQTYYFKDLTVEVPYTQEHITFADYQMDINASSTWYLIRAEGRTFCDGGDTENVNLAHIAQMYMGNYEALRPDVMSAFHHGHNMYSEYIDKFYAPIMFYTSKKMYSWASQYNEANKTLLDRPNVNYYCYGDGAYRYTFATGEVTEIG